MSKELTRTAYLSNLYLATSGSAMIPLCTPAQEIANHDALQRATIQQLETLNKGLDAELEMYRSIAEREGAEIAVSQLSREQANVKQLKERIAQLDALLIHDYIPRADFVREQEARARADSNLSEKLIEIDGLDEKVEQLEARVKEVESELMEWHSGNGGIVKRPLDSSPDSC